MNDYVTERELQAHLKPVQADIWEIKGDVKTILLSQAASQARTEEAADAAHEAASNTKDTGARRLALGSLVAAMLSGLWWVPDAVAKLAHH